MKSALYKLAVWYIGKCNAKWNKPTPGLKSLKRLTYRGCDKAYLLCGSDAEWRNFSRYDVLDNAIQKLADYEDADIELQKRNADWCGMCHNSYDCEDKEEFMKSDRKSCPWYS